VVGDPQPLALHAAEDDAAVLEDDRVQRAAEVEVADAFDIYPPSPPLQTGGILLFPPLRRGGFGGVVHDEELQGRKASRAERVAVAGEHHLAARQRTGPEVEDAIRCVRFPFGGGAKISRPVRRARVRRALAVRQPHDLATLDVDLVNVGTDSRSDVRCRRNQVAEMRVIDPFAVERDVRVGHRARAASHQDVFAAVGAEQDQVGAVVHDVRLKDLRPIRLGLVVLARRADVDDVVIDLHRRVRPHRLRVHVERLRRLLRILRRDEGDDYEREDDHGNVTEHRRPLVGVTLLLG